MSVTLLFFGELPPHAVNGISLSNAINLHILEKYCQIMTVVEKSDLSEHSRGSFGKAGRILVSMTEMVTYLVSRKFDVFYTVFSLSRMGALKTLLATLTARFFGSQKIIVHLHRGDFQSFYSGRLAKMISRAIFHVCSELIVLSNSQKAYFSKLFPKPIHVLENSLGDVPMLGIRRPQKRFIYISNYLREKGVLELIKAFEAVLRQHPDVELACYGAVGDQTFFGEVVRAAGANIKVNGPILGKEKYKVLHEACCFILPSWNEGQPLVILEAMSQGVPVIASCVGLVPEMVGDAYPYLVSPQDVNGLSNAMLAILNDKTREVLGSRLRERYVEKFGLEVHERKVASIFLGGLE